MRIKFLPTVILLILLPVICSMAVADLYRWKDDEGNVHYGNTPPTESGVTEVQKVEQADLPELTTTPGQKSPSSIVQSEPSTSSAQPKSIYQTVEIIQPGNDTSIRENAGNVTVSVRIVPPLQSKNGHLLAIYLDGTEITVGTSTSVVIPNVDRGTHQLQVTVIDARGKAIERSAVHTFTLHRHSRLFSN